RRQINRFTIRGEGTGRIGGIKRIWNENGRFACATADPAFCGNRREEQAFARAVEHQHFVFRINWARKLEAPAEPHGDRAAKRFDAFVGGIATEIGEMRIKRRADKFWNRVL